MVFLRKSKFMVLLFLIPFMDLCKPRQSSTFITEVDSLIMLTLDLQQKISSPEIQRLSEFRDEALLHLQNLEDSIADPVSRLDNPARELHSLYARLNLALGQCLRACSQFHEEAFLLENTLQEIKHQATLKGANRAALREILDEEWILYHDLSKRIDSSLENAMNHAKNFYTLRMKMDSLLITAE